MTIVIGLDPGMTQRNPLGVAVVDTDAMTLIYAGVFNPPGGTWEMRVRAIGCYLRGVMKYRRPELVAYEIPPYMNNAQTLVKLSMVAGVIAAVAELYDVPCVGVSPAEAKVAVANSSQASKEDVMAAVERVFGQRVVKDAADAAAVSLAGEAVWRRRLLGAA